LIEDEVIYTKNAKKEIMNYIQKHFGLLLPLEVTKGYHFQIRISKEDYEILSQKTKDTLRLWAEFPKNNGTLKRGSEEEHLYFQENYWSPCKAHIFNYNTDDSFVLRARCKYGYEGLEECYDILFFNTSDFPEIIFKNLDSSECKHNFKSDYDTENKWM